MRNFKPLLKSFVFCDRVFSTKDGRTNIEGVFQQLIAKEFPVEIPFKVYLEWSNLDKKDYDMKIHIFTPGKEEPQIINHPIVTDEYGRYDYVKMLHFIFRFHQPGDVVFEIYFEGEFSGSFRLPILHREIIG